MKGHTTLPFGIIFRREHSPAHLPDFARRAEAAGFDALWVVEDTTYYDGIAAAATALASTEKIKVGLGIMPAVVRNPVFTAMAIATLANLHLGRFLPGIGHGSSRWMHQVGAFPASQLAALEEVVQTVKALLAGKTVQLDGQHVHLTPTKLVHPPRQIPPISLGVAGPKSLRLSGRLAEGTILSEYSSPAYVRWAQEQIRAGMPDPGAPHRLTLFIFTSAAETTDAARDRLRLMLAKAIAAKKIDGKLASMDLLPEARRLREQYADAQHLAEAIPADWIDALTLCGTPADWQRRIEKLVDAGVDEIVLSPHPALGLNAVEVFARHLGL